MQIHNSLHPRIGGLIGRARSEMGPVCADCYIEHHLAGFTIHHGVGGDLFDGAVTALVNQLENRGARDEWNDLGRSPANI